MEGSPVIFLFLLFPLVFMFTLFYVVFKLMAFSDLRIFKNRLFRIISVSSLTILSFFFISDAFDFVNVWIFLIFIVLLFAAVYLKGLSHNNKI